MVRLRPGSLQSPAHVAALLRHELMHIEDLLDPAFGYDLPPSQFHDDDGVPTQIRAGKSSVRCDTRVAPCIYWFRH